MPPVPPAPPVPPVPPAPPVPEDEDDDAVLEDDDAVLEDEDDAADELDEAEVLDEPLPPQTFSILQSVQEQPSRYGTHEPLSTQFMVQRGVLVQSGQTQSSSRSHVPSGSPSQPTLDGGHWATLK